MGIVARREDEDVAPKKRANKISDLMGLLIIKKFSVNNGKAIYCLFDHKETIINKSAFDDLINEVNFFYSRFNENDFDNIEEQLSDLICREQNEGGFDIPKKKERKIHKGYVYFVGGGGYYKIGKAVDMKERMKFYEIKMPFECKLVHVIKTNDIAKCEKKFHKRFDLNRRNGEWFQLNENDIQEVKNVTELNF